MNACLIKKGILAFLSLCLLESASALEYSLNPFIGRLNIGGSVVSSSCSIEMEDAWQSINMGIISEKALYQYGAEYQKELLIRVMY
ncbi:hypothetical protein [Xenorhabdus lircayensis]|uniref:Fimbrial protein n=1 Tax=Xenorhabdus lircayensis TaxID=2763499 RepID=A0ABS0UC84_9GAMM|nr:hypothetical protein [Xenorhabdus lircayensis]MBI6550260.1 hypothetical protein [Xenorhabdus lircayensis]